MKTYRKRQLAEEEKQQLQLCHPCVDVYGWRLSTVFKGYERVTIVASCWTGVLARASVATRSGRRTNYRGRCPIYTFIHHEGRYKEKK